jgi:signal transduction histidine kinase
MEFLNNFLTSGPFIPHGHCYLWNPHLVWLHAVSDALIALSYYSIPITLVYFVQKRKDLPFNWIFLLFGAFIILCGSTHIMEIWTLWLPFYWQAGFVKAITALASVFTAVMLIPLVPQVLALPSPAQLEAANLALSAEITERKRAEAALRETVEQLQSEIAERQRVEKNLRAAQNQIIVQEKLASLGSLTAGIAHEIRNPLNFVNNFAQLSADLAQELSSEIDSQKSRLEPSAIEYITDILNDIERNVNKINEHGGRAARIVSNMLLHARGEKGEWSATDINTLVEEAIKLAYHGMRGNEPMFNVSLKTAYDNSIEQIKIVPPDINRALINILSNACYAVNEKKKQMGDIFIPELCVQTKNLGERVEIEIQDNGFGIPQSALDKIFHPFFTTKPPGEGTGLGLSITHDIIVQQHRGELKVETAAGKSTTFIIILPKNPA